MKIKPFGVKIFFRAYIVPLFATVSIAVFAWSYRYSIPEWWVVFIIAVLIGHYYFYFRRKEKEGR